MRFYIVRHGDAESRGGERELTVRGFEETLRAGQLLAAEAPDALYFSPKMRTRQTADQLLKHLSLDAGSDDHRLLPPAGPADVASILEACQARGEERVVLVSHMPMVAQLVGWFSTGDPRSYSLPGFPEAGVVAMQCEVVGQGCCDLLWYAFPPGFERKSVS